MNVSDHLVPAHVLLGATPRDKRDLLETIARQAASQLGRSTDEVLGALIAREDLGSTALGKGLALPHAQLAGTASPFVSFARLSRPIDFDARDTEPIDLVFLLLWPAEAPKGLLKAMSEICQALRDPQFVRQLRLAQSPEDVVRLLRNQASFGRP